MCKVCSATETKYLLPFECLAHGFAEGLLQLDYFEAERVTNGRTAHPKNNQPYSGANGRQQENENTWELRV